MSWPMMLMGFLPIGRCAETFRLHGFVCSRRLGKGDITDFGNLENG
jgi:hypothetical protein